MASRAGPTRRTGAGWGNLPALVRYEARVAWGWMNVLPLLALPAFALLSAWIWASDGRPGQPYELVRAFEVILPLSAGLASAHLPAIEREEGFEELRRSYPEPSARLPLLRTVDGLILGLVSLALGWGAFRLAYGPFSVRDIILPALPPALYLLGLALLLGSLTRSYWATAAAVMGYWFLEAAPLRGLATGHLFLFQATWPLEDVSYPLNRALLAGVGIAYILASVALFTARRRGGWRRGRRTA